MKLKLSLFLFIIPLTLYPQLIINEQLMINEIMSNNVSAVMDDSYNYSMWVEVYNPGNSSANLNQYYFTDDLSNPKKWKPSSKVIPAKGFAVIWFEREENPGHATFKLEPEGDRLYLNDKDGYVVDVVKYPQQHRNVSYGRSSDGADNWVFFTQYSPGVSNNGKTWASEVSSKPVFEKVGGFYSENILLKFETPGENESIYYTTDGSEPTISSKKYTPGSSITINKTTCVRAVTFSTGKIPSTIVTHTYFIRERNFNLPVVSIVIEDRYLNDKTIGIYTVGTNGVLRTCPDNVVANYNRDWDRPANMEFFNPDGTSNLNQEIDVEIAGGCSRAHPQKSLKLTPRKKHGDNEFRYDFFADTKPNRKYSGLLYRNSGNDFGSTMLRDGFMQTLIQGRMDIDGQAYIPTICFINGQYYGIQNLRETSNHRNVRSNYGWKQEEIFLVDDTEMAGDPEFQKMVNFAKNNDITKTSVYQQVEQMIDINSYMDYMIAQIYFNNGDWPHHNFKMWKKIDGGKWRPIIYDTDFGWGLFGLPHSTTKNAIRYVLEENQYREFGNENVYMLRRLMQNDAFKKSFIDRFSVHISSTFEANRANHILDSLASRIRGEIGYHKQRFGQSNNFESGINSMKSFSQNRPETVLGYIGDFFGLGTRYQTVEINSNIDEATYQFFSEEIKDSYILLKYFQGQTVNIKANPVKGYNFKHWKLDKASEEKTAIPMGSTWKYWDKYGLPAANWHTAAYNDNAWSSGAAQFGWGGKGEKTTISYGGNANDKYPTSYYRKTININDVAVISNPKIKLYIDDGAVIYVNGVEIGRYNLPEGEITFNTYANTFNNGVYVDFNVPKSLLTNGVNLVAVEVHQDKPTTSDAMFNLSLTYMEEANDETNIIQGDLFTATLNENISIKAVYEKSNEVIEPEEEYKIFINEIVSSNKTHRDEHGNKDDYIEIYNDGDEAVNIGGWYLSDIPVAPTLYKIPDTEPEKTTIPSKGRVIFWADKEPDQGVMHTNFSLNKGGDMLILSKLRTDGSLRTIDLISIPALETDMSYSRVPDGADNWLVQAMTFNLPNSDVYNSVEQLDLSTISIYPTYVRDHFTVNGGLDKQLRILDLTGKTILQKTIRLESETVQIPSVNFGIYIVLIGDKSFKIVKQ